MSDHPPGPTIHDPADHDASAATPAEMRLRPERPPVTRLSRKVLLGLGSVATFAVAGALFFALRPHPQQRGSELYNTTSRATPQGLADLPHDYTGLPRTTPRLGPPLPGDLGKPILNAGAPAPGMPTGAPATPEQQRVAQEQDAARTSHLFATSASSVAALPPTGSAPLPPQPSSPTASTPAEDHKLAFMNAEADHQTVSQDHVLALPSPYTLQAGSIISAALITGLRSDLPGEITAQVTSDVKDSVTGTILLVPTGTKLIGQYDAQVSFGQSRALLVWTRLILPNGRSITLKRQPGVDTEGYAGLEDEVDNHWGQLFEAAILSTVLSVGSEAGTSDSENNLAQAIRQGASQSFNQTGEQIVGRSLNIQPTITIRPGFPVNVLVDHDLILEPYQEKEAPR